MWLQYQKNVYIHKLDDIVNKDNNTNNSTIKMKSVDVKSNTHINSTEEINDEDPKFKFSDIVTISKYKIIYGKGYVPNWSEEVFVIKKVKNTMSWTVPFYEKELQKTNKKEFRVEKVIKRIGDKLYVKWKGYDNSFKSCIYKRDIV